MNNEFEMKESLDFAISGAEREIADKSVQMALDAGASAVMVSLDKAKTEIYALLDGEIDNIRQTGDRSLTFNIYADGKYGTFSTNRFEEESLRDFLCKAVETVRMLVADPFRGLPDKKDLATDAVNGDEMGLCWYGYGSVSRDEKLEMAKRVSVFGEFSAPSSDRNWRVVSEEVEYNNTLSDTYLTSSDGCRCRQTETSFEVSSQVTVEDNEGNKYSGLWWDYDVSPEKVLTSECGRKAVEMAVMQIAPVNADKGKYTMVVSRLVSGRLLQPVLNALSSLSIYQKSSFLVDALGKQVFSKGLNVMDMPLEKGKSGAILFETDGRACRNREIISDGVVKENFTSIYMSRKLGIPPTSSCPNRPVLLPFVSEELLRGERGGVGGGRGVELGVERADLFHQQNIDTIYYMFKKAGELEIKWGKYITQNQIMGFTDDIIEEYIHYLIDQRLVAIHLDKLYNAHHPIKWVDEFSKFNDQKANFFESKVTNYSKGSITFDDF